jgi:hypothetical protein
MVLTFGVFLWYYSSPLTEVTTISIEPDYDYGGSAYNCTPLIADTHYGVRFNYDTCRELMSDPSTTTVVSRTIAEGTVYTYYPFIDIVDMGVNMPGPFVSYYHSDLADQDSNGTAIFNQLKSLNDCASQGATNSDGFDYDTFTADGPFNIFQSVTGVPGSQSPGVAYPCTITQTQAIDMFTKFNELNDPCFFTKINSPFSCVTKENDGWIQRISLSYANALLVQSLVSMVIVNGFFSQSLKEKRASKTKNPMMMEEVPA